MHHFPESLQAEIRLHLNHDLFEQFDIFDGLSDGCLRALAAAFRAEVFPNQLHLLKEGDLITKLYFIVSGSVEVLQVKESTMCLGKDLGRTKITAIRLHSFDYDARQTTTNLYFLLRLYVISRLF